LSPTSISQSMIVYCLCWVDERANQRIPLRSVTITCSMVRCPGHKSLSLSLSLN